MTIELKKLTKRFGTLTAVDAIDLTVGDGEVLCLLGPSGCGKTTTLRMVAGLEMATEGDVILGGKRVNGLAPPTRSTPKSSRRRKSTGGWRRSRRHSNSTAS